MNSLNSLFRKTATPILSSIFRKGAGGMTSMFKKAPYSLKRMVGQVRNVSDIANKLTNNPILEGLARSQGYGKQFDLAKRGAGGLDKVASAGDIGVKLQGQTRGLKQSVIDGDIKNILEKAKAIKGNVDEVRAINFQ